MVIGRYELRAVLARGGMATVYLGRLGGIAGFSRAVAIKRLHPQFATDPSFVAMFVDEARLAGCIHHPHVVSVNDVVAHDGELLLVMDFVHGASLSALLSAERSAGRKTDVGIAARVLRDALQGLHAAHEARDSRGQPLAIVHRDVSPQNILVDATGVARIIDFGVAKAVSRVQNTREGQLKGKLCYMAPEQLRNQRVDRRVDVYAAAAVLWDALAGRSMFDADNEASLVYAILEGRRPSLREVSPHVPEPLLAVVERGLSLDARSRFASAAEMAEAIESAVALASERDVARWLTQILPSELERQAALQLDVETHVASLGIALPSAEAIRSDGLGPAEHALAAPAKRENAAEDSEARPARDPAATPSKSLAPGSLRITHFAAIAAGAVLLSTLAAWMIANRAGDRAATPSREIASVAASNNALQPRAEGAATAPFPSLVADAAPEPSASAEATATASASQQAAPSPAVPKKKRKYYGF